MLAILPSLVSMLSEYATCLNVKEIFRSSECCDNPANKVDRLLFVDDVLQAQFNQLAMMQLEASELEERVFSVSLYETAETVTEDAAIFISTGASLIPSTSYVGLERGVNKYFQLRNSTISDSIFELSITRADTESLLKTKGWSAERISAAFNDVVSMAPSTVRQMTFFNTMVDIDSQKMPFSILKSSALGVFIIVQQLSGLGRLDFTNVEIVDHIRNANKIVSEGEDEESLAAFASTAPAFNHIVESLYDNVTRVELNKLGVNRDVITTAAKHL